MWARARELAFQTPPERNRYVDFLRALSICAVVVGHWLMTAPWFTGGTLRLENLLAVRPWTQWLTLLFQVMPVFFFVGGYANAASWESARRSGRGYGPWLSGRLRRLVGPVVPLLLVWLLAAIGADALGVEGVKVHEVSLVALVPLWFLAVYVLVILFVPLTLSAWERWGFASFWMFAAVAVVVDIFRFHGGHHSLVGWGNYLFIWLSVHQLGFAWRAGRVRGPGRALLWAAGGATAWIVMVRFGPYPVAMVSVPGQEVSNTLPPDLMLLALALVQWGVLLAVEKPLQRWLARPAPWTATVLVNSTIMSLFLWHVTAMALLIGLAVVLGEPGLGLEPGSGLWWLSRPLWLGVLALLLAGILALVGRFERLGEGTVLPIRRALPGALLFCFAIAVLAFDGIRPADGPVRLGTVAVALVSAVLLDALPRRKRVRLSTS
jgi:fucose 4-O-acetylase-like acetyltransferase